MDDFKLADIKVLPSCEGSLIHVVFVNGDPKYKCITKERGESIKVMAEALIDLVELYEEADIKDKSPVVDRITFLKAYHSLENFGIDLDTSLKLKQRLKNE